jgi:hypothetical protein
MVVVLRVVTVRSNIGVFLNELGPRVAGSIEKDAFTSLLCPENRARGTCDASPPPGIGSEKRYIGRKSPRSYVFLGGG